jgi:hypothetical protein
MNGVRRNSSRILRWRAWIASPWVWALLAMSIVMVWGGLEMTEAEFSNLMQHDPIERPRSKTTSSV